jgi:dihydroorotate dehydrogenase (NAD+) catalytic subunit
LVVKGLTLEPRAGNPPPRTVETPSGMLNAIGLQNPGAAAFIADKLPYLRGFDVPVIVNLNGAVVEEYRDLAAIFDGTDGVHGIEVNISCPNVERGGMAFSADPCMAAAVTKAVRDATRKPVIVKLSPNVTDLGALAQAVADAGADAVSVINTLVGMAIDVERRKPVLANLTGGLSGPAIRPVAVRCVWEVYRAVSLPIVGMGGITCARDALELILAGATAVAVGTATFTHPGALLEVRDGIAEYLERHGIESVAELVGQAHGEEDRRSAYHLD